MAEEDPTMSAVKLNIPDERRGSWQATLSGRISGETMTAPKGQG